MRKLTGLQDACSLKKCPGKDLTAAGACGCAKGAGQVKDAAGKCACPKGTGQVKDKAGKCDCGAKTGQIPDPDSGSKCGCPKGKGQVLNAARSCGCPVGTGQIKMAWQICGCSAGYAIKGGPCKATDPKKEKTDKDAVAEYEKKDPNFTAKAHPLCDGNNGFANMPDLGLFKGAPCGLEGVIIAHEKAHVTDFKKDPVASLVCVGKGANTVVSLPTQGMQYKSECRVYQDVHMPALGKLISNAKTGACQKFLQVENYQWKGWYYGKYNCASFKDAKGNNIFKIP